MRESHEPDVEFTVADLRDPERATPTGSAPPRRRWLRLSRRGTLWLLAALAILGSVGGALVAFQAQQAAAQRAHPLGLNPVRDGIALLSDAAWSPDGAQIAVLGLSSNSLQFRGPSGTSPPATQPIALIYSYPRLRLATTIRPQAAIEQAIRANYQTGAAQTLARNIAQIIPQYVVWSLDSRSVSVAFQAYALTFPLPGETLEEPAFDGLATFDSQGQPGAIDLTLSQADATPAEWDLRSGTVTQWLHLQLGGEPPPPFAAAPAYRWGAAGTLLPVADPPATLPVGQPVGGTEVTIWQPGDVVPMVANDGVTVLGGIFTTSFHPRSPDGRYLATITIQVPLDAEMPTTSCQCPFIATPPHDAPLTVLAGLARDTFVAWSPGGLQEAALIVTPNQGAAGLAVPLVRVFDTRTGSATTLPASAASGAGAAGPSGAALQFAPDGHALLALDLAAGVAQVFAVPPV